MQALQHTVGLRSALAGELKGRKPFTARAPHALQARPLPVVCRASAGGQGHQLPSAWVAQCLERAQRTAVLVNGRHFIPLSEAQRWFEAGQHEGDAEFAEKLNAAVAEHSRLQSEMEHMAEETLREHDEHEQGMRRLLNYALALEAEVGQAKRAMKEAALEAAHEAEEKLLLQYQQMLMEYEAAHEAESHAVEETLRGQVKHLETMLRAAHEAKKQWRERALQAEEQFAQLRSLIQVGLKQATEAAQWRAEHATAEAPPPRRAQAGAAAGAVAGEQPPPPLHANPRIRASEAVSSADADVAAAVHHVSATSADAPGAGLHHSSKGNSRGGSKKKLRRGAGEQHNELHSV